MKTVKFVKDAYGYKADTEHEFDDQTAQKFIEDEVAELAQTDADKQIDDLAEKFSTKINDAAEAAATKALQNITEGVNRIPSISVKEVVEDDPRGGFKHFGEWLCAKKSWDTGNRNDKRMQVLADKASTGLSGGTAPHGEPNLPEMFVSELQDVMDAKSTVLQYIKYFPTQIGRTIKIPVREDYDRTSTTATARVTDYALTDTSAGRSALTASYPNFDNRSLTLNSRAAYVPVTDELLADNGTALGTFIQDEIVNELLSAAEEAVLQGVSGLGDGVINDAGTLGVARNTATQINVADVANMRASFWGSYDNAVWVTSHSGLNYILQLASGSGNANVFQPDIKAPAGMMLFGRPLLVSEHAAQIGFDGDLVLIDGSKYFAAVRGDGPTVQLARSVDFLFSSAETAFRGVLRWDSKPKYDTTFTLKNGDTVAPIVELGTSTAQS